MELMISGLLFTSLTSLVFLVGRKLIADPIPMLHTPSVLDQSNVFGDLTGPIAMALPISDRRRRQFAQDMLASGEHQRNAVSNFLAKRNLTVFGAVLSSVAVFVSGIADGIESIVAVVAGVVCLIVFALPGLILGGKASKRKRAIERAIPDAMDMVAISINGGLPLVQAVDQVATQLRDLYPALAGELRIISRQSQSGSVEQAFDDFSRRIELPEIAAWCAMMRQSQKLGGELARSLFEYAARIRIDRQSRAERAGNTASLKLLLPVVLCLAPPIAVLLIGPAVIEFRDFLNREKGQAQSTIEQVQQSRNQ